MDIEKQSIKYVPEPMKCSPNPSGGGALRQIAARLHRCSEVVEPLQKAVRLSIHL
jgi:hypothetical protein